MNVKEAQVQVDDALNSIIDYEQERKVLAIIAKLIEEKKDVLTEIAYINYSDLEKSLNGIIHMKDFIQYHSKILDNFGYAYTIEIKLDEELYYKHPNPNRENNMSIFSYWIFKKNNKGRVWKNDEYVQSNHLYNTKINQWKWDTSVRDKIQNTTTLIHKELVTKEKLTEKEVLDAIKYNPTWNWDYVCNIVRDNLGKHSVYNPFISIIDYYYEDINGFLINFDNEIFETEYNRKTSKENIVKQEEQKETIFEEAERLIHGDRQKSYGSAKIHFADIGRVWGMILDIPDIEPRKVALCMAGLKIAREKHKPSRENKVDCIGYIGCADDIVENRL